MPGRLQEPRQNRFHVFAYVACFGDDGGVGNAERHFENFGDGPGQVRFAGACFPHHDNVRLFNRYVIISDGLHQPLVVVINRYGDRLFGVILTNYVLVEVPLHVDGLDKVNFHLRRFTLAGPHFFQHHLMALFNTVVTDVRVDT